MQLKRETFAVLVWTLVLPLCAQTSPLPSSAAQATNGLPLSDDTRALIQRLQFDLNQLRPLLAAAANGQQQNPTASEPPLLPPQPNLGVTLASPPLGKNLATDLSQNLGVNLASPPAGFAPRQPPAPQAPPSATAAATTSNTLSPDESTLLISLQSALADAQESIREILPRLDQLPVGAGYNSGSTGSIVWPNGGLAYTGIPRQTAASPAGSRSSQSAESPAPQRQPSSNSSSPP